MQPIRSLQAPSGTLAGALLIACALFELLAISHHPTVGPRPLADVLPSLVALSPLDRIVHGTIIAIVVVQLFCLTVYTLRRGTRELAVAGFIAYALGSGALMGAALVDGFLIPDLVLRGAFEAHLRLGLVAACSFAIQVVTKFGLFAIAAAVFAWSIDLLRDAGRLYVPIIAGFACVAGTLWFVPGGPLAPHQLLFIVGAQSLWYIAIGTLLFRARL